MSFGLKVMIGGFFLVAFSMINHALSIRILMLRDDVIVILQSQTVLLNQLSYFHVTLFFAGLLLVGIGSIRVLRREWSTAESGVLLPLRQFIGSVLNQRRYWHVLLASSVAYGLFYSFVSSIIVYQPTVNFSEAYLAAIPSVRMFPGYGEVGQVPILVAYLTEHLGLLIIPLNVFLLFLVASLVGLNMSLAVFAYDNRPRSRTGSGGNWLGGLGALTGLFTACPTCAGLFMVAFIGGSLATTLAVTLAYFQALFIGVSIPILLLTPILIHRSVKRSCSLPQPPMSFKRDDQRRKPMRKPSSGGN